jgi:hypothetical protein
MIPVNPKSQIPNPKSTLAPPQFGLRTLLLLVTACAVLFALAHAQILSPIGAAGLVLLALSIFCHVAGNCIGTRLRSIGDHSDCPEKPGQSKIRRPEPHEFAPATHLSQRRSLGWIIVIATFGGIILGGLGGGFWTFLNSRGPIGATNVAVGVIAFATLGGIASFAVVSFTQVLLGAIWQAMNPPAPHTLQDSSTPTSASPQP